MQKLHYPTIYSSTQKRVEEEEEEEQEAHIALRECKGTKWENGMDECMYEWMNECMIFMNDR